MTYFMTISGQNAETLAPFTQCFANWFTNGGSTRTVPANPDATGPSALTYMTGLISLPVQMNTTRLPKFVNVETNVEPFAANANGIKLVSITGNVVTYSISSNPAGPYQLNLNVILPAGSGIIVLNSGPQINGGGANGAAVTFTVNAVPVPVRIPQRYVMDFGAAGGAYVPIIATTGAIGGAWVTVTVLEWTSTAPVVYFTPTTQSTNELLNEFPAVPAVYTQPIQNSVLGANAASFTAWPSMLTAASVPIVAGETASTMLRRSLLANITSQMISIATMIGNM